MTIPAIGPIRVEVKFHGGSGHRERFGTLEQAVAWLATPAFTARAHRVRTVTIVAPRPEREDQAQAQPSPASRWRERVLSGAAA